jgi:hypothetical protein
VVRILANVQNCGLQFIAGWELELESLFDCPFAQLFDKIGEFLSGVVIGTTV